MDQLTIAVRLLLYLDLMVLFGVAAFDLYALRGAERVSGTLIASGSLVAGASLGAVLLSLIGLATLAANLGDTSLTAIDREVLNALLFETSNGIAWQSRLAALAVAFGAAGLLRNPRTATAGAALATATGGVALATLAWAGHGAAAEGGFGWLQLVADIFHLLAAGLWVGALVAMLLLVLRPAGTMHRDHLLATHRVLAGFSTIGTIVVGTLTVTGLINLAGTVGVDDLGALPLSRYGQLLIVKLALFAVMLALAASNRFRLVPAFETAMAEGEHAAALMALRRSLAVESLCAVAILALVAWLGTLDPSGNG